MHSCVMCRDCLRSFRSWGAPCVPSTTPVQGIEHHCTCVTLISSATEQGLFTSEMWLGVFFFLCLSQFIASALVTVWMRSAIKVYYLPNFAEPCLDTEWALCSEPFLARNQSTCVLGSGQIPALGARLTGLLCLLATFSFRLIVVAMKTPSVFILEGRI